MVRQYIFTGLFLAGLAAVPTQASAIFTTLTQDGCTGTCGVGPYGTISLAQNGTGDSATVTVTEMLASGENFAGTGAGDALDFNIDGTVSISGLTSGYVLNSANPPYKASVFGNFLDSILCTTCQGSTGPSGPLTFTVSSSTGVTTASFVGNSGGYFFASDIAASVNGKANTGNVAAFASGTGGAGNTPEPATMVLTGSALIGAAILRRRKRKA